MDALMWVLAVALFTMVWRAQDLVPQLSVLHLPRLTPILIVVLLMVSSDPRRSLMPVLTHPLILVEGAILGLMCLSVPTALWPGGSFGFIVKDHMPNLALMLVVAASVRSSVDVERLIRIQVAGSLFFCVWVITHFQVSASGRLGTLAYYDANDMGMVIVATLPLALYEWRTAQKSWTRLAALAGLGIMMYSLVKTGSRGGFLGLVAVSVMVLFTFRAVSKNARIVAIVGLFLVLLLTANQQYWAFIETLRNPTADYNWTTEGGRVQVWKRGMGYMFSHPLTGVGPRNFPIAEGRISPRALQIRAQGGYGAFFRAAHNSFVEIGAELGIFGLLLFIVSLVLAFRTLRRITSARGDPDPPPNVALSQVLAASVLGYIVTGFFLTQAFAPLRLTMFGIIVGLSKLPSSDPAARKLPIRRARRDPAGRTAGPGNPWFGGRMSKPRLERPTTRPR